jgi:multidrug resistance efflux pump
MHYPVDSLDQTTLCYLPKIKSSSYVLYLLLLSGIMILLACLPFVYTDISIKANGLTRPGSERTEVKPIISGIIDSLFYKEGDSVQKNAVILRIKDLATPGKRTLNQFEITQRQQFIHDLGLLTSGADISSTMIGQLNSPLYSEQASRFIHQKNDQEASLKKANKEVEMNAPLARDKVISPKEFFDLQINQEKSQSSFRAFTQEQLSAWQQDLVRYRLELSQYQQQMRQVNTDATYYEVKAPISGIIQGINTRYAGGSLQVGETFCNISPEETLVGECYVQTRDIGLLKTGQAVRYQFEAFNYNYFGVLTGKILRIDNDFTPLDNKPFFKVRCSFDTDQLRLKNGFTGQLKKGLGFQASFMVTRRSLWQLLFDKMDDWLNPDAPATAITTSN